MTQTVDGIEICLNEEQFENACFPIEKIDGSKICVSDEHPLNADSPIDANDVRIDIFESDLQSSKALSPIDVTNDGMMICSSKGQFLNAEFPILVTELGTDIRVREEQPSNTDLSICFIVVYE